MKKFNTLTFCLLLSIMGFSQEYDNVDMVDEGITIVQEKEKYGIIKSGKLTIPIKYDYINRLFPCQLLVVKTKDKYGILNYDGQQILSSEYDDISLLEGKDLIKIAKEGKQGLINLGGKEIIPCQYDDISLLEGKDLIEITKQGKLGLIDIQGKIILEPRYDTVELLSKNDSGLKVSIDGKYGLKNISDGNDFSDQDYDYITVYRYKTEKGVDSDQDYGYITDYRYKTENVEEKIWAERKGESGFIDSYLGKFYLTKLEDSSPQYLKNDISRFIANCVNYPVRALDNNIQGRVNIEFVVEKDGTLTGFSPRGTKLGYGLEEEVIRCLKKTSGDWQPGVVDGKLTSSRFRLPVVFRLPK